MRASTSALLRAASGCTDSDNNANDFATGTPAPPVISFTRWVKFSR